MRRALILLVLSGCLPESNPTAHSLAALSTAPARTTFERDRLKLITGRYETTDARAFLAEHATELGLDLEHGDVQLASTRHGLTGDYLRFNQTYAGLPVFDG